MRVPVAVVSCLLGLTVAQSSEAAPLKVELDWEVGPGADSCIEQAALEAAVEVRLGRDVFADAGDLLISGAAEPADPTGFHISLTTRTPDGELVGVRELDTVDEDCSALDEAIALVIALVVDRQEKKIRLQIPRREPPRVPDAPPPPKKPRPRRQTPPPPPPPADRTPWSGSVGGGADAVVGLLPELGLGLRVSGRARPPAWPAFELSATAWQATEATVGARGAQFDAWQVQLDVCPRVVSGSTFRLGVCGGVAGGSLGSAGFGFDTSRASRRALVSAMLSARPELILFRRVGVGLRLGLGAPLSRERYFFVDRWGRRVELFRPGVAYGLAGAGLDLKIP